MSNLDNAHPSGTGQSRLGTPTDQAGAASLLSPERLDGYVMLAIGLVGTAIFASEINWIAYFVLFWVIDVFGYWPGVVMCRLAKTRQIPNAFTHLYNLMHSNSGALSLTIAFALISSDSLAAALAIPVHLGIDRGILGNRLKQTGKDF